MGYQVYAVKTLQPNEEGYSYWTPLIYAQLQQGVARFGWSWHEDCELTALADRFARSGRLALTETEQDVWKHSHFLLEVKPGDYFVYINMPQYGECTLVQITEPYRFTDVWNDHGGGDFRHALACRFVGTFDRKANFVHPYLRRRLSLQGAWYTVTAQAEFEELLDSLQNNTEGPAPSTRIEDHVTEALNSIA